MTSQTFVYRRQTDIMIEELAELHQDHGVARVRVADVTVQVGGDPPRGGQWLTGYGPLTGPADSCRRVRQGVRQGQGEVRQGAGWWRSGEGRVAADRLRSADGAG